jgi:general secretion pathway protein G|tara:strand:- start:3519 stop:4007 length:489 start_codon:yes stop_codon:yes gene_type:complete
VILFKSPKPCGNHLELLIAAKVSTNMNNLTPPNNSIIRRGFTLIEILIVVVILGILAAVVVPQFTNAADDANDAAVRTQLQTIRGQIELYRAQQSADPALLTTQWTDLIDNDYLMIAPNNPLASSNTVAAAAAANVGWVWRDKGNGTFGLYACDGDGAEFSE